MDAVVATAGVVAVSIVTFSFSVPFSKDDERLNYLIASARLRNMSRTRLIRTLVETVLNDQLIQSILDDDVSIVPKRKIA